MQKISSRQRYALIGAAITITLAATWSLKAHSANKQISKVNPAVKITTTRQADGNIPLEISGFVRGENRADISPAASGRILRIFRHEGEAVKKGDVLATIEIAGADAQVAAASASVDALDKTLSGSQKYYDQLVRQAKEMPSSNSADAAVKSAKKARDLQIQAARSQLVAAQGSLGIARAGKNNSTLVAPFAGTITAIYAREGGFANFSMPLMSVSTQDSQEIETYVSATDGRSISVGSMAALQPTNGESITGTVTAVSAGSDSLSLNTLIRIHINDNLDNIHMGDFIHGQIMVPRQEATISIPRSAVISRGGDQVVFILDENNITKEQSVRIGSEHGGLVDIIEGVSTNQKIVIEGQQYLITGLTTAPYEAN